MKNSKGKKTASLPIINWIPEDNELIAHKFMRLFLYVNESGLVDIIRNQRIRLSCAWRTNDATEAVAQNEFYRRDTVNDVGYICLSAICDSPAMWGYYADRSRGACLVFDFPIRPCKNRYQYQILNKGTTRSTPPYWLQEIKYNDERCSALKDGEDNFDLLTTKSMDWQHEREYRIFYDLRQLDMKDVEICASHSEIGASFYIREILENLSGIILGVNSSTSPQEVLAEIQQVPIKYEKNPDIYPRVYMPIDDINVIKAKMHPTHFAYDIDLSQIHISKRESCSKYFPTLLKSKWIHKRIYSMEATGQAQFVLDPDCTYMTTIHEPDKELRFYISKEHIDNKKSDTKVKYALFMQEGADDKHYPFVYNINTSLLHRIYEHAVESSKTSTPRINTTIIK